MSKQEAANSRFTANDLANLTLMSQLYFEKRQAHEQLQEVAADSKPEETKFLHQIEHARCLNQVTRFLTMHGETIVAARTLCRAQMPVLLDQLVQINKGFDRVRDQRIYKQVKAPEKPKSMGQKQEESKIQDKQTGLKNGRRRRKLNPTCHLEQNMRQLPHIKQALDLSALPVPEPQRNPLQSKLTFKQQPALKKQQPASNIGTTGISITNGNYLNISSMNEQRQSTWQTLERKNKTTNLLGNNIDTQNSKKRSKPDFGASAEDFVCQKQTNKESHIGGKFSDAYRQLADPSTMQESTRDRLQRLMEDASRQLDKKQDQSPQRPTQNREFIRHQRPGYNFGAQDGYNRRDSDQQESNNGFQTAHTLFKKEQKKFGYQNDDQQSFQEDQNRSRYPYRKERFDNDYQSNNRRFVRGWQNSPQREEEPKESATDRLLNNAGRQPGIGGRRRFVPPKKGGDGGGSGFHPGKSVQQHMVKNFEEKPTEDKGMEKMAEYMNDERYKNLDPQMVELIENEIIEKRIQICWDDIAGLEQAKKIIHEIIIWPMLRPDIFTGLRAPPRGVMFFGPPGTGKTLLGKAIAAQSKSTFLSISASTLTSKWVGEGEKMVRTMFAIAAIHQPSVVFIDEIDSLLSARTDSDQEGSRRIKTEFLVQLDGANTFAGEEARILIIGATNRPDDLDEAVRRRLVKRMYIPLPNSAARRQFLDRLVEKERKDAQAQSGVQHVDLDKASIDELVAMTKGYSGSDLKGLVTEAAMIPLRQITDIANIDAAKIRPTGLEDFKEAIKIQPKLKQDDLDNSENGMIANAQIS